MNQIDFNKNNGLIPCIIQDYETEKVLMLGYMNAEALEKTKKENTITFYSRTKQQLWTKGETSGNYLNLISITPDCDNDTLLIKVKPTGPACHTGADTCFDEKNSSWGLKQLEKTIQSRKDNPKDGSYTSSLFESGINKIVQKVGEEAVELVIESKDQNDERFLNEAADLMYHYLVLLAAKNKSLSDVEMVLKQRHQ